MATLLKGAGWQNFKVHLKNILIFFLLVLKCFKVEENASLSDVRLIGQYAYTGKVLCHQNGITTL